MACMNINEHEAHIYPSPLLLSLSLSLRVSPSLPEATLLWTKCVRACVHANIHRVKRVLQLVEIHQLHHLLDSSEGRFEAGYWKPMCVYISSSTRPDWSQIIVTNNTS